MDWDWEDGPPQEPPPRRGPDGPDAGRPPRRPESPGDSVERGLPSGRPPAAPSEYPPEPERPGLPDESETQVFAADAAWERSADPAPQESAPHSAPPEFVLPDRTETGRSSEQSDPEFAYLPPPGTEVGTQNGRRPRSSQDRAARREQRRRQLRRRRIVALAILIAIVVLIVVLVVRGCGGSDAGAAAALMLVLDGRWLVTPGRQ